MGRVVYKYNTFVRTSKQVILEVGLRQGFVSGCDKEFFDGSAATYQQKGISIGLAYTDRICPDFRRMIAEHSPNDNYPKTFFIKNGEVKGVEGGYWDESNLERAIVKHFQ